MSISLPKSKFLALMRFPEKWLNMYPDELAAIQMDSYELGDEKSSEHFRFGAFIWWEKSFQSKDQLGMLIELTYLDPDQLMAAHARERLLKFWSSEP